MFLTMALLVVFLRDDFLGIMGQIAEAKLLWATLSLVTILAYWLIETLVYQKIVNTNTDGIGFLKLFKITLSTQFFNGITPFATGGQPFQIYILGRETGYGLGKVSSSSLQNFVVYQLALIIYGFIAIITQLSVPHLNIETNSYMKFLIFVGFSLNFLVIAGLVILGKSRRISHFFFNGVIEFLGKIRIIKDMTKTRTRIRSTLKDFHDDMKILGENKKLFVEAVILNMIKLTLFYSVAYLLCLSLGIEGVSYLDVILASAYTMLITSLVPLPGASGGAEFGFLVFFSGIITGSAATAVMLLWRFFTYYVGLILGFLVFTFGFGNDKDKLEQKSDLHLQDDNAKTDEK